MEQQTMKAYVLRGPGQLVPEDVPVPKILEPTDVIARVTLTTLCRSDIHTVAAGQGPAVGVVQGHEFTCTVVEAGPKVRRFRPGDRCVAAPAASCGECPMCRAGLRAMCMTYGTYGASPGMHGSFAEYIRVPQADRNLYPIPRGLSEEDVIFAGDVLATGMFGAQRAEVREGSSVVIFGCGPIGMGAAMTAKKILKAGLVIAADPDRRKTELLLERGYADAAIDVSNQDPAERVKALTGGWGVDSAVDSAGADASMNAALACLRPGGTFMSFALRYAPWTVNWADVLTKNLTLRSGVATLSNIGLVLSAIEHGDLDARFIQTHRAPLNDLPKGLDVFGGYKDGCLKWMITPYEHYYTGN